jgi:hypothetical protein
LLQWLFHELRQFHCREREGSSSQTFGKLETSEQTLQFSWCCVIRG